MDKLTRDKYVVHEEFDRLVRAAKNRVKAMEKNGAHERFKNSKRDVALLTFAGCTGARQSEILAVRISDLNLSVEPPMVTIIRLKKRGVKKDKPDDIVITPINIKALKVYLQSMPASDKQPWSRLFPLSARQCERLFKRYCKIAGLSDKYTFHALRHYRGLSLWESSHDIELVRTALGHSNIASTQIYIHTLDHVKRTNEVDAKFSFDVGAD